jgi:spore coat protein U-like protein
MKRYTIVLAAIVIVIVMVGGAYAGPPISETVGVTATVSGLCKVGSNGTMSFAIPDPSVLGPILATTSTDATVLCSNAWPYTVTATSLNNPALPASCGGGGIIGTLKDAGSNTMNYTFTCGTAGGTGAGFGNPQPLNVAGSIAQAAYLNAAASATYADTITLTINY